jgi:fatty acid desaturase
MNLRKHLPLLAFPAAEIAFFVFAVLNFGERPAAALLGVFLAALALCFCVHVCFHEMVHASGPKDSAALLLGSCAASVLQGLPFDGYRCHHDNHHRCNNSLEDYSSTWEATPGGPKPQTWWRYSLLWPRQLSLAHEDMRRQAEDGRLPRTIQRRIRVEKWLLIAAVTGLGLFSWKALLLYALTIYGGWTLVALHNYGQHSPFDRNATKSYPNALYNALFCNNGLHHEHHRRPHIPWYALTRDPAAPQTGLPYLLSFLSTRTHGL